MTTAKERSASDPAASAGVRVPPPLLFAGGLGAALALDAILPWRFAEALPGLSLLGSGTPWGPRLLAGGVFVALGLALALWAAAAFRRARTTVLPWGRASYLVPEGPYRFSRNPMYLGMALAYAGLALALGSWWAWPMLPVVLLVVTRLVIAREERHLEARFGDDYARYRDRVRRWL